ncbi:SpaH/EbpB family LPXTG-anchored major pilin [Macrococcus bovicus]|uniref:Isopeptide-forming domain-containing fimbrial protein n=1 Tax=Macrococcus bovicus TaxID=69968 RepID=A0A4V3BFT3_9STAP|nr:SpaH/EbpB family LPXTG-anchored major pilin [Macrococcus bovicus]TDM14932.1 isopeptide-forming domain-containing fimbrial protein [Macrococcus bovicus]
MSKLFKRLPLLLVLALLVSIVLPVSQAFAANETTLTIHKIDGTGVDTHPATNGELTGEGQNYKGIQNISFTYWSISKEQFDAMKNDSASYKTVDMVEGKYGDLKGKGINTGVTDVKGEVKVTNLAEGYYWFVENTPTTVASSAAVPFGLSLPLSNEGRTGYINDLHVYPKNILETTKPTIDKDVKADGTKEANYNVGDEFNWFIQPTIVKGIADYAKFTVTDKIDTKLDFNDASKVVVELNGQAMLAGTDYVAEYDAATRILKVDFTSEGRKKLGTAIGGKLNIKVPTKINNTAIMGQAIKNNATLTFDNNHGTSGTPSVPKTDIPKVYTGGKNFIKTAETEDGKPLPDAKFVIKNSAGEFVAIDDNGVVTYVKDQSSAEIFTSKEDGTFEVKGLAYGTYTLIETKAPEKYTRPTNPETPFTVDKTSYYTDPEAITSTDTAPTAAPTTIINKQTFIPNTGGIGTVIFTVVGLALMVLAFVLLRRRQQA